MSKPTAPLTVTKRLSSGTPAVSYRNGGPVMLSFGPKAGTKSTGNFSPTEHDTPMPSLEETMGAFKGHWVPWGRIDDHPREVALMMRKSPVGRASLLRRTKAIYGQLQITYKIIGYDSGAQPIIQQVTIPEWEAIKTRSNYNAIRLAAAQDFAYYDLNYMELMFNDNKTKVWKIDYQKTSHCRMDLFDPNTGRIPRIFVSGRFPYAMREQCEIIPAIDFIRYPDQMDEIRKDIKSYKYLMPQFWPDVLNDYYPEAFWFSAKDQIEINTIIPIYKKAIFRNQMTIKYHIQIPYEYLTELHQDWQKLTTDQQDAIIDDLYQSIIDNLTGAANTQKAILSFFKSGSDGKPMNGWQITAIDDKMKNDSYLPDESASASIIQFAFMQNPAISGQGNTGGNYTGGSNNGGSNIRESLLDMRSLQQADRDLTNSFFNFIRDYNGWDPAVQLGTQDMVLTTLDTGAGSADVVS